MRRFVNETKSVNFNKYDENFKNHKRIVKKLKEWVITEVNKLMGTLARKKK